MATDDFEVVEGIIVRGHQVASGRGGNTLFPGGTLAMQTPVFRDLGLDLSDYYPGTLNTSIAPLDFEIIDPDWHFAQVAWHPTEPPEDFSFVKIGVARNSDSPPMPGLVYYPHPETKPTHHQPDSLIEILLTEFVDDLTYGKTIRLNLPKGRIKVTGR